jgi:hypothetical protein
MTLENNKAQDDRREDDHPYSTHADEAIMHPALTTRQRGRSTW